MARASGLNSAVESIAGSQRLMGPMLAATWSRTPNPPVGPGKAGYYAAALMNGANGDNRARLARCLIWCDVQTGQYVKSRLEWYRDAALAFPEDERCVFFVGALCYTKIYKDPDLTRHVYLQLIRPEWEKSRYWAQFEVNRVAVVSELAKLLATDTATITPERVAVIESVLHEALEREDRSIDRKLLANYLGVAYRSQQRTDENAEIVYRFLFNSDPEDTDNTLCLAQIYKERNQLDAPACAVYARMTVYAEEQGREDELDFWTQRLAQAYLNLNRLDEVNLRTFARAMTLQPDDKDLQAAYLCGLARRREIRPTDAQLRFLEAGMQREADFVPRFRKRRWDWSLVPRALAYAYGTAGRTDEEATAIYARAVELCPEERDAWGFYAKSLAARDDYSEAAISVYERAFRTGQGTEAVLRTLGQAYITAKADEGEKRETAIRLWETLYRQGMHWPEMVDSLTRAYVEEETVNDIALSLWERRVAEDAKNGPLRLRLAQEYRFRSDWDTAAQYYREAAKLMPKDFTAQYEAGHLLMSQFNDYTTAIRLLQKAVKLPAGEKHLNAHFALGEALLARDKRDEARVIFQKIVDEIDANHTTTLLRLAKLNLKYEEEGVKKAEALYEQAAALDPQSPETYRKMAELYREKGQSEEEQQALEKYLELAEPDAERCRQLADLYIRRGDFIRAEGALRQVIALGDGDKKLYSLLGEVIMQGRLQGKQAAVGAEIAEFATAA